MMTRQTRCGPMPAARQPDVVVSLLYRTVYCGLSAVSPQKDRKPSTPSNDNNRYQASSAPCFVRGQQRPITEGWFWVNCTNNYNCRSWDLFVLASPQERSNEPSRRMWQCQGVPPWVGGYSRCSDRVA